MLLGKPGLEAQMATLHSLLSIYGAIDQKVGSGGPTVAQTVERFLPGTTGPEQGWFEEIQDFVAGLSGDPAPLPDLDTALRDFGFEATARDEVTPEALGAPMIARLTYAVGTLAQLPEYLDGHNDAVFAEVLALAGPTYERSRDEQIRGTELLALLRTAFTRRDQWQEAMEMARTHSRELVSDDVSRVPPVCLGSTTIYQGQLCTELTSEFSDEYAEFDKVKTVIDPMYWDDCCQFFCSMTRLQPDYETGWYRYLEEVSPLCGYYYMRTALEFWKELLTDDVAVVEYDLDRHRTGTGDTGEVLVDQGYLEVTNLNPGVLVRTSKVVRIDGMNPVASAMWSCVLGWVDIGQEMILGCARTLPDDAAAGDEWISREIGLDAAPDTAATPTIGLPEGTRQRLVFATVNELTDCIDEVSKEAAALAKKASTRRATIADVASFSAAIGARLASDPWRFLEALTKPAKPPRPPAPNAGRQP
jgi:hypothetical protein